MAGIGSQRNPDELESEILAALGEGRMSRKRHDDLGCGDAGMELAAPIAHGMQSGIIAFRTAAGKCSGGALRRVEQTDAHVDQLFFDAANVLGSQRKDPVVGQEHVIRHLPHFLNVGRPAKGASPMAMHRVGRHRFQFRFQDRARLPLGRKYFSIMCHSFSPLEVERSRS